jgi:NAD(P)-dependent dehydrogenase (short-subunit alcohol dehydrogenase family)
MEHEAVSMEGRVAIVTGAGRGLGRAHAIDLARHGASVVVNDVGGEGEMAPDADAVVAEIVAAGGKAVASRDSVATREGGRAIVARALEAFGTVDAVVSNAGVLRNANFEDLTVEQLDEVLDIHVRGAFFVLQPAFVVMRDRGYGRVVLTGSSAGAFGMGGLANYATAKAGLMGLARALAIEGAEFGIRANTILPYSNSPWRGPAAHASRGVGVFADHDVLRPRLEAETVSPLVTYLASSACTVTGEVFSALAGRFARAFVGLTPGWLADDPYAVGPDDIAARLPEIMQTDGHWIPATIGEEQASVAEVLRARSE